MYFEIFQKIRQEQICTFAELTTIPGFTGDHFIGHEQEQIYYWFNCSEEAIMALDKLYNEKLIRFHPLASYDEVDRIYGDHCPPYEICHDGEDRGYPQWLPVYLLYAD